MSKAIDDAWDALPPQEEIGESTWDPTPEAAALRSLFGASAFRHLGNAGVVDFSDRDIEVATAVQEHIASNYLFSVEAHRRKPDERYRQFVALRDSLLADDICLACGDRTPGRSCQCENDE